MHGVHKYLTMYLSSLVVKTPFDVATPGSIADISEETGVRGWIIAALLEEMDLQEVASSESCEMHVAQFRLWRVEEECIARAEGLCGSRWRDTDKTSYAAYSGRTFSGL